MSKETMKLALRIALEDLDATESLGPTTEAVIDAAQQWYLAEQPAQQEPVAAECKFDREEKWVRCEIAHHNLVQSEPEKWPGYQTRLLYTSTPAQRKPLSDDELYKVFPAIATYTEANKTLYRSIARAIEAAHGIKGDA